MTIRRLHSADILSRIIPEIGRIASEPDPLILTFMQQALQEEASEISRDVLISLCENISIAKQDKIPACQDTGTLVVFAELGREICLVDFTLQEILNQAMQQAQKDFYLRASMVADPLFDRINSGNNTPVILHLDQVEGDRLKLVFGLKGGGAENMSRIKMFTLADRQKAISDFVLETVLLAGSKACPPLVIGIGIGGNLETCAILAKRALFDPLDQENPDPNYAMLEKEILKKVNETGIGAMGMGGKNTAFAVKLRSAPCHIASFPIAVNLQCHSHRHAELII